jgi:mannosyltransferase
LWAAIVPLAILGLALAFHDLGAKSVVLDEAVSVAHARLGAGALWDVVSGGDPNMGAYYVLLHVWVAVFGDGETAIRSLSAIAAGAAVPVVALLGARLFGRPAGLVAGLLLALDAFFVQYAQTARSYGPLVLLVALSSYWFVVELERPSRASRVGYVAASVLAFYAHYFAAFVVIAQLLTLLAVRRRAALTREWLGVAAAIGVLCAPEAVFARRAGVGAISWIPQPGLGDLGRLPAQLAGGSRLLGWALVALGAYAVVRALRDRDRWRTGFVAAWLLVPVVLAFAASFVQPMFLTYYLIVSLPALVLLAGAGVARLPGRIVAAVAVSVLVVLSALRLSAWYSHGSEEDYRGAAAYVVKAARPGDGVAFQPTWTSEPIVYYQRRAGATGPAPVDLLGGAPSPREHPRLWLVMRESDATPARRLSLERSLSGAYERVAGQPRFRRVLVVLYRARPNPGS